MEEYIVLSGSPFDGFCYYGSFSSFEEAEKWADEKIAFNSEWWVAKLDNPYEL